ncbi:hypothetical protein ANCCAN_00598 [Ancylostoma caninum]|uniref:snRNA-activating protein complex subunit 3 n=1 Tax=Ancylostoma caninum TaxID=29170 RepID=A0A368HBQ3_ANCCA|nr:hypothetical protein ANCCAN_00598 [Ancylostoma caninum]
MNAIGPAEGWCAPSVSENDWHFEEYMNRSEHNCEFEGLPDHTRESRHKIWGYNEVKDLGVENAPLQQSAPNEENKAVLKQEKEATCNVPDPHLLPQQDSLQPLHPYSLPFDENNTQQKFPDDIVAEVAIFIGYPRPLEKHEIRLGRLMKVLDRFLVLGSNTLLDLKKAIDCTSDYQVLDDVSDRSVARDDLCKNRFPSSYFFVHDTFYVDLQTKGAKDITAEIRRWASERSIADMKMADMSATKWVVWEHECMPSFTQFLCDPCYKEFNYDVFGKKIFDYKAAPCYDRRNRRAGPVELQSREAYKENVPVNAGAAF